MIHVKHLLIVCGHKCRYLNFDLHCLLQQPGNDDRRSRSDFTKIQTCDVKHRLSKTPLADNITNAYNVGEVSSGLLQRRLYRFKTVARLLLDIVRNDHRRIIIAGRACHKHPRPLNHRARIARLLFKWRASGYQPSRQNGFTTTSITIKISRTVGTSLITR